MLKETCQSIIVPLTHLINLSFSTCTVPLEWKKAQVTPIYKKNSRSDPNNYRPISVLPTISKLIERIVFKNVYNYFLENSLLTRHQSCVPGDSTVNQLSYLYHSFCKALDDNKDIQIIYCDVKKAFEKVWHDGLVFKLKQLGVTGNLLAWLQDYLSERYQRVGIRGQNSEWKLIPAGVPQGSVLGPLLFMVYINDLVQNINCNIKLYADDTTLYITTDDLDHSSILLNEDLQSISSWAKQWLVTFCPEKTVYMHMTSKRKNVTESPPIMFNGKQLQEVDNHKHLGITLNHSLSWSPHVRTVAKGAGTCIDAMRKLKYTVDRQTLDNIYQTFVRPKLEYANVVWNNCTKQDSNLLESLQLDAARIVTGARKGTSHDKIYNEIGWPLLSDRREQNQLVLFYKMVNDEAPPYLTELVPSNVGQCVGDRNLRNHNKLRSFKPRTVRFQKSFLPNVVNLWNNLDINITTSEDVSIFKSKLNVSKKGNALFAYGSRKIALIHAQMRMLCSCLNAHLYALHVQEESKCMCGYKLEDNKHFFIYCPMYNIYRIELLTFCNMNNIDFNVNNLLFGINNAEHTKNVNLFEAVHKYIEASARFN